jgi:hypothetical protein
MNNPFGGKDPTGYSCDSMTGTYICGKDTGAENGQSSYTMTKTVRDGDGSKKSVRITVSVGADGARRYTQVSATSVYNGSSSSSVQGARSDGSRGGVDSIDGVTTREQLSLAKQRVQEGIGLGVAVAEVILPQDGTDVVVGIAVGPLGKAGAAGLKAASSGVSWRAFARSFGMTDEAIDAAMIGKRVNKVGRSYPAIRDLRTGEPIPFPSGNLTKVPKDQRVIFETKERGAFIKEWYDRGYETPRGGWGEYDIHHIRPKEYGGDNSFDNLTPVLRRMHQDEFNPWWQNFQ